MKMCFAKAFNILIAVLAFVCAAYYVILGMTVRFNQSLMWIWPILIVLLLVRHAIFAHAHATASPLPFPRWLLVSAHVALCLFFAFFLAVEGVIFKAGLASAPADLDYIIVLGAKVNGTQPGGALRNRIQVASEYAKDNPRTLIIASGGQGDDEGISEALCIRNGLVARGVPEGRILMEDTSTSTYENIHNSLALIDADESTRIGLVTNDFHIYRAVRLANNAPVGDFCGVRVASSFVSFPHYMIREFAAVVVEYLQGVL